MLRSAGRHLQLTGASSCVLPAPKVYAPKLRQKYLVQCPSQCAKGMATPVGEPSGMGPGVVVAVCIFLIGGYLVSGIVPCGFSTEQGPLLPPSPPLAPTRPPPGHHHIRRHPLSPSTIPRHRRLPPTPSPPPWLPPWLPPQLPPPLADALMNDDNMMEPISKGTPAQVHVRLSHVPHMFPHTMLPMAYACTVGDSVGV